MRNLKEKDETNIERTPYYIVAWYEIPKYK
jgi:hypothetical protein